MNDMDLSIDIFVLPRLLKFTFYFFYGAQARQGYHLVACRRHKVIKLSQQSRKSMIKPSMRATMAVHFPVNTLIIISLLQNEPSAAALPIAA